MATTATTPTNITDTFLRTINTFIRTRDSHQLSTWLLVEPPLPQAYTDLQHDLRARFSNDVALDRHVDMLLPEDDDNNDNSSSGGMVASDDALRGNTWPGFNAFMREYLVFWREIDFANLLDAHRLLSVLVSSCISALSHASYGIIVLPTAVNLSRTLVTLTMNLDKRPDLLIKLRRASVNATTSSDGERKSLVERVAESIQKASTICISDRSPSINGIGPDGRPYGKKIGIYLFTNLVLKLYFQCRKTRLSSQLFTNVQQHSPPLGLYPASQRVTYLYYLGRFFFANSQFYRASLCLTEAYSQCHRGATTQRRQILIYLLTTNLIIGLFPTQNLASRPEARDILPKFLPLQHAIRKGDFFTFKSTLHEDGENFSWFFKKGLLIPILYRCEVLVWRSLARRTFLLTFDLATYSNAVAQDANYRSAATLQLRNLVIAAQLCQKRLEGYVVPATSEDSMFVASSDLEMPAGGPRKLSAHGGVVYGNTMPDLLSIEAMVASLVQQGVMHGFIAHGRSAFAVLGGKGAGGPLKAGWPVPYQVVAKRRREENGSGTRGMGSVPGWVQEERRIGGGGVVNLKGARAVGSG